MICKKRSASSVRWLKEHFNDKYVKQAWKIGVRSRSWFKLDEIQQKDKLLKPGMTVIDLGSAPGGWSQYAAKRVGGTGCIIACDLLPMDPIVGVDFIQGDFRDKLIFQELLERIGDNKVQIVMSDSAINMCGTPVIDISHTIYLVELILEIYRDLLEIGGSFVVKVFQGEGLEDFLKKICSLFAKVKVRKLKSSRARSREMYVVAVGYKS